MPISAATLRLTIFVALMAILIVAERRWPRRGGERRQRTRWPVNFGLVVIDSLLLRVLLGAGAVGAAQWAQSQGYGLLRLLPLPTAVSGVLALIALDCLIYWQHRVFHAVPALWRLHRVHHSDTEFDVSTALRFHPAEILLSMLIKMAAVVALGAPVWAVITFEVLLNGTAMFNHANLRLPAEIDRALRRVVVTPDMHRVHHSVHREETDSNFGFNVPWWDWLFGSYRAQPANGHEAMQIGLERFRDAPDQTLARILAQPLK